MEDLKLKHEDFEVVRIFTAFGGYEEVQHKDKNIAAVGPLLSLKMVSHFTYPNSQHNRFFRKSLMPNKPEQIKDLYRSISC